MIYTDDLQLSEYCFDERRKSLFVTLTSRAYLDYTLNLIESVRRLGLSDYLLVFVLDIDGYNALLSKASETGVHVIYYPNRYNLNGMQLYQQDRWHLVSFCKIEIVFLLFEEQRQDCGRVQTSSLDFCQVSSFPMADVATS